MKLKYETHIPPEELRNKCCGNCSNTSIVASPNGETLYYECNFDDHREKQPEDQACDAFLPIHYETLRVNGYKKL
ncbi:hypothetical protein LCGC14_1545520 [marine sediment metagenome]|uniref:Uncharacterized protein n=1 Tax=marine sediment metagenome TaxID=412755 RepID=A0A0F9IRT8_9ZZZZ